MTRTASGPTGSPDFPDDSDPARYELLLHLAARTGRAPVWLGPTALDGAGLLDRPEDVIAAIDGTDAGAVLAQWWPGQWCLPGCGCGEKLPDQLPIDPAAGSAPDLSRDGATFLRAVQLIGDPGPLCSLAVVDAARPADIPAVLGWSGICNYHPTQDLVRICAVLRRWERRWGALLVGMDRSRLCLSVAHPPTTEDECRAVAAEHFAFCPDQQDPQDGRWFTLSAYAGMIRGAGSWRFWWD